MTDEAVDTLAALEQEAAAELAAVESEATETTEESEEVVSEDAEEEAAEAESASSDGAEQRSKKMVEVPVQKLAKMRQDRRTAKEQLEAERAERALLEQQVSALKVQVGLVKPASDAPPTLKDHDYDESAYHVALTAWNNRELERKIAEIAQQQQQRTQEEERKKALESEIGKHYERVATLGLPEEDYIAAESSLRDKFSDADIDIVIAALGEGSEKVLYHLGTNEDELGRLLNLVASDITPTKAKVWAYLGKLNEKLQASPPSKKVSRAPSADRPLSSASGQAGVSNIIKKLERLDKMSDRTEYANYRKQLIAKGQSELLRKHGYL